jgi:hypothetical protein
VPLGNLPEQHPYDGFVLGRHFHGTHLHFSDGKSANPRFINPCHRNALREAGNNVGA